MTLLLLFVANYLNYKLSRLFSCSCTLSELFIADNRDYVIAFSLV